MVDIIILIIGLFNTAYPMTLVEEYIEHYTGVQKKDIPRHAAITQPIAKSANEEFSLFTAKSPSHDDPMYIYQLFRKKNSAPIDVWHDSSEWKHAVINNNGTQILIKRTRFQYNNTHDVKTGDNSDYWLRTITYENQKKRSSHRITTLRRQLDLKYFFDDDVIIALEENASRTKIVSWNIKNNFSDQELLPSMALNYLFFNPLISSKRYNNSQILIADIDCKENPQQLMVSLWNVKTGRADIDLFFEMKSLSFPFLVAVSASSRYYAVSSDKHLIARDTQKKHSKSASFEDNIKHIYFDDQENKIFCLLIDGKLYSLPLDSQATQ